jgi:hypothetical protein
MDNLPPLANLDFDAPPVAAETPVFREQLEFGKGVIDALDAALKQHAGAVLTTTEQDNTITNNLHLNRQLPSGEWIGFSVIDHNSPDGARTVTLAYDKGYHGWGANSRIKVPVGQPAVLEVGDIDDSGSFIPSPPGIGLHGAQYWPGNIEAGNPQSPKRAQKAIKAARSATRFFFS